MRKKSLIRILLRAGTATIVMGSCLSFVAQLIQAQVMHLPVGSRWKCHIEYEASVAMEDKVWSMSEETTAVLDGEFRLKRAASVPSLQTAIIDLMERTATLTEAGLAAGKDEETVTAEAMKITEPLMHDLEGIEGKVSGTIISSQGPSRFNIPILASKCSALPKKSFSVEWPISGGFSFDSILLQVDSGGWRDPREIECQSKAMVLSQTWATFKPRSGPSFRSVGNIGKLLEYKNGEQRFDSKLEYTGVRSHVVEKFNLTSECPVSTSLTDAYTVTVQAEKPPMNPPDNTLTKAQLGAKRAAYLGILPQDLLHGWTVPHPMDDHAHPRIKMSLDWEGCNANFGGNLCLWVKALKLEVSLPMDMYIAKEYPAGSCKYNVVYEHEKKHVESFYSIRDKYTKTMQVALETANFIPSKGNPLSVEPPNEGSAEKAVENRIHDLVLAIFHDQYLVDLKNDDVRIDTPSEIRRADTALSDCDLP